MNKNKWPNDYPAGIQIPPEGAVEVNAHLFRLVTKPVPDADDFLASNKDPKQRHLARNPKIRIKPGFYGTSFFDTRASIEDIVNGNPERFDGQLIAEGQVEPKHGKGELSKHSNHVSMWLYDGVYPEGFKVV